MAAISEESASIAAYILQQLTGESGVKRTALILPGREKEATRAVALIIQSMTDKLVTGVIRMLEETAVPREIADRLANALEPVLTISDRKHDAWDAAKQRPRRLPKGGEVMLVFNVSYKAWGVAIGNGIASHSPLTAAVFVCRADAQAFCEELQPHIGAKCRVVRVEIAIQQVEPKKRKAVQS